MSPPPAHRCSPDGSHNNNGLRAARAAEGGGRGRGTLLLPPHKTPTHFKDGKLNRRPSACPPTNIHFGNSKKRGSNKDISFPEGRKSLCQNSFIYDAPIYCGLIVLYANRTLRPLSRTHSIMLLQRHGAVKYRHLLIAS